MRNTRSILRTFGSLWLAALLLVLLGLAMACATVFESMRGAEEALYRFYHSWWFELLGVLLVLNVTAAILVRFPLTRRQAGFLLTHTAIVLILGGAVVTGLWGVDGRVALVEGQSTDRFLVPLDTLSIQNRRSHARSDVVLAASGLGEFDAVESPDSPRLHLDDVEVEVIRFLPDAMMFRTVAQDDSQEGRHAVHVSLSRTGRDAPVWVFENETMALGPVSAMFRRASDSEELGELLKTEPETEEETPALVRIEVGGVRYEVLLDECMAKESPVGDTGYRVRVLRYLPHATVGPDNKLMNVSLEPVNPAIEAELIGPRGTERRLAFARFPDFSSMHGDKDMSDVKLTLIAAGAGSSERARVPVEVILGPEGEVFARFQPRGAEAIVVELSHSEPVDSAWPGLRFAVLSRSDSVRLEWEVEPVEPVRKERIPAVLVRVSTEEYQRELWLQKHRPRPLAIDSRSYELAYGDKEVPLGFTLRLDQFRIGRYPGETRPRSFESRITIVDPAVGSEQSRVTSMNHPAQYGGFTIFQSSYSQEGGRTMSVLSVSRDPGQPIVFTGYIMMILGMIVVLGTRMQEHRRMAREEAGRSRRSIPLGRYEMGTPEPRAATVGGNGHGRREAACGRPVLAHESPKGR